MLLNIHPNNPQEKKLKKVHECLKDGGVIIYPTDTVYTMGCDLLNTKAVEKVAGLKDKNPENGHFSFICHSISQLSDFTKPIDTPTYKLLKKTLPGPYTYILRANSKVPKLYKTKRKEVGIRIPDARIPLKIVEELGNPIISTSIHDEDRIIEYTTDPELIHEKYKRSVDIVINGGMGQNEPSTVVNLTAEEPEVIRQGRGEVAPYL